MVILLTLPADEERQANTVLVHYDSLYTLIRKGFHEFLYVISVLLIVYAQNRVSVKSRTESWNNNIQLHPQGGMLCTGV
jgi:hypothetical protein